MLQLIPRQHTKLTLCFLGERCVSKLLSTRTELVSCVGMGLENGRCLRELEWQIPLQKASFRRKFCQCCLHRLSAEFVAVLEDTRATCGLREQVKYGVSVTGVRASILFSQHFFALELFQLNLATYTRHVGAVCCDSSSSAAPF